MNSENMQILVKKDFISHDLSHHRMENNNLAYAPIEDADQSSLKDITFLHADTGDGL